MTGQPADALESVRRDLGPAEGSNRLVPLVAEGRLPRERIAWLAAEEYRIVLAVVSWRRHISPQETAARSHGELLGYRFRMRGVLQGEPIVLAENGQLIDRNMRRERLTHDDLAEKARLSEIASIADIKWAVLETNGDISFIKQPAG